MQVHIIIYIRTPACARWYAYTTHKHNMIGNLKGETRKTRHPSPPFTSHHLNLKIAFTLKTYYEDQNWSSIKTKSSRLLRQALVLIDDWMDT